MFRFVMVLAAFVALSVANDCSYPCPTGIVASPICAKNDEFNSYHTFSSQCVIDCHAARNPARAYKAISAPGTTCATLGYPEQRYPISEPNEFDWPYDAPSSYKR